MAVTQNTYTGNGSTTNYSFTFPYLNTTDIFVSVNGIPTTAYTLANATTVSFNAAPANGAAIRIYRQTANDSISATFYPGSAIRSQDLNGNFTQSLYVTQETTNNSVQDVGNVTLAANYTFNGTASGLTPTLSTHFATKGYVDSQIASYGNLAPGNKGDIVVQSGLLQWDIASGVIVNADINASAAIAVSKLGNGTARQLVQTNAAGTGVEWTTNISVGTVAATSVSDSSGNLRTLPQNSQTSAYTLIASDTGKHISITTGGVTVPASVFNIGDIITIYNNSGSSQTITQGASVTLRQAGTTNTGNRTLGSYGVATLMCTSSNTFVISGAGLS